MKVLILEDNRDKSQYIEAAIQAVQPSICTIKTEVFSEFFKAAQKEEFDLIVVDLLVPRFPNTPEPCDVTDDIIEATREADCKNLRTPIIAITQFLKTAEGNFERLNHNDIHIVTFKDDDDQWRETLQGKVRNCIECQSYEFIVICALPKETDGFFTAGYDVGPIINIHGMECRTLSIDNSNGLIITLPRMGLVNCAITTSRAIDLFKPKIIAMSGICAGIKGETEIYDVVIPDSCEQYDFGKWGVDGFQPEIYTVQISNETKLVIRQLAEEQKFMTRITESIKPTRKQIPENKDYFGFRIFTAHSSSGSGVVANDEILGLIKKVHRKTKTFEMESYAVYEAARLSPLQPQFFSVKSVVDNGDTHKGDAYHFIACQLAASVTVELIRRLAK